MYCRECGKQIVDGERFCRYCGTEQVAVQEAAKPVMNQVPNLVPNTNIPPINIPPTNVYIPQKTKNNVVSKVFIVIGGMFVGIIGLAVLTIVIAFLFGGETETKQVNNHAENEIGELQDTAGEKGPDDNYVSVKPQDEEFVKGFKIRDSYQMYDFQLPTDRLDDLEYSKWSGIELVEHELKSGENENDVYDIITERLYYEHPEGLFSIVLEKKLYYLYWGTLKNWGYLDDDVNFDNSRCDFSGLAETYWEIENDYYVQDIIDYYLFSRGVDLDGNAKAYLSFENYPVGYFQKNPYIGETGKYIICADESRVGKIYLVLEDNSVISTDIYVGYNSNTECIKFNGNICFDILVDKDYGYLTSLFEFYTGEKDDPGYFSRISREAFEAAIQGENASDNKQSSEASSSEISSSGAAPGGREDFEGSWGYVNQAGQIVIEKIGNTYVMEDFYNGYYTYTTWKYMGEYDQNKKILVLNSCKIVESEYNEATQQYDTREHTENIKGYVYNIGDGNLYWVEGKDEYNPNDEASYIMPRMSY